jgi:hypothetical protein
MIIFKKIILFNFICGLLWNNDIVIARSSAALAARDWRVILVAHSPCCDAQA